MNSQIFNSEITASNRTELTMLSEITNAIMQSLELDQVLYTILTSLTSDEGLGFDRAMLFLVNEEKQVLEGRMGIGPHSAEEADKYWHSINSKERSLQYLVAAYNRFKKDPESKLNSIVKDISIPLREDMGILALTILEGMPFEIANEEAKSRVNEDVKNLLNADLFATIPLKTKNRTLGAILVDNIASCEPITKDSMRILNMFADQMALAIENSRLYEETVRLSRTDWLTGLWNTRYFNDSLHKILKEAEDKGICLSLLMIDIDNFKVYNDTLGHKEGDKAIKRVSGILDRFSRKSDFACRYGGEEFCIIMENADKNNAQIIAERLRSEVCNSFKFDDSVPENLKLTISVGVGSFPDDGNEKDDLIEKADIALYYAKHTGKNKTCAYDPAKMKKHS
ncbi:MAG: sensor domain-containing diguanylate cyclase [Candidatus Omnitrophota bacterium]